VEEVGQSDTGARLEALERALQRERQRRLQAESILEERSRELYLLNQELESKVLERTRELKSARDRAQEASQSKSRFLSTMSHELRTPLNGILGFSELLKRQAEHRGWGQESLQQIDDIHLTAGQLAETLSNILEFTRFDAGDDQPDIQEVDLRLVLKGAVHSRSSLARKRGISILLNMDASLPVVIKTDRGRLGRALAILLDNAVRFSADNGTVTVTVRESDGPKLEIEVKDEGIGFPPESSAILFRPFAQLDEGSTRNYSGTGLGLPLCRQICLSLGGTVVAHSEGVGRGSSFTLSIQLARAERPSPLKEVLREQRRSFPEGLRVLVVEDTDVNRRVYGAMLKELKAVMVETTGGQVALNLLEGGEIVDLVFLDLHMPGMDGGQTLDALRKRYSKEDLPVWIISAENIRKEELLQRGANGHLLKPVRLGDLGDILESTFGGRVQSTEPEPGTTGHLDLGQLARELAPLPFHRTEVIVDRIEAEAMKAGDEGEAVLETWLRALYEGDEASFRKALEVWF